jgi:D-alanine transaminase
MDQPMLVYLNGEYLQKEDAKVSVDDRGFLFGDGVYEVTRVMRGKIFEEEAHWQRLQNGLSDTRIDAGQLDRGLIREISQHLIVENGFADKDATVYLQITRGSAPRAHYFPKPPIAPTVYAFAAGFTIPTQLRHYGVEAITHPDIRWARCDIKSINLLPNVVAKQHAVEAGAWESVLIRDGAITEGSSTNIFGVIDGELRTFPKSNYILPGVTRDVLIGIAREEGIPFRERPIYWEEIPRLQELFASGTTTDVQALVKLDGKPVGDGSVGPVTMKLLHALMERLGATFPE